MVTFPPPPRCTPGERATRYTKDRRLSDPKSRSGRYGEEKDLAPAGNRTLSVQSVADRYTD
jgi:hypothetical protein